MKLISYQKYLVVKPSLIKGAGLGLFSKKYLPKGTKLGWYRGVILTRKQWLNLDKDRYTWLMFDRYDREYYIDARPLKRNNKLRYVNGSFTPGQFAKINVEAIQVDGKMWYVTTKKVYPGEELIIHYGNEYEL
jgi:uncharacterized protein